MRAIVNVATGGRYIPMQDRLRERLAFFGESLFAWRQLPPGCPPHTEVPYGFKYYALADAQSHGFSTLLWLDSSVIPIRKLDHLWKLIEDQGYWFSNNPPHTCGEWTADSALEPLGITREEAFQIPHLIGTAFGLDFRHEITGDFWQQMTRLVADKRAFQGPWTNQGGAVSADPRVRGHRHDQTVMSVLAYTCGMHLTQPPKWIVDGWEPTEETILTIHR